MTVRSADPDAGRGEHPLADAAALPVVGDGGVVVKTAVWLPAPAEGSRGVRAVDVAVRSDAAQLAEPVRGSIAAS